ncbi:MAG: CPBP family intramembrane metalloprotease [Planctomycetes bacterium]|nr:CPBP family intramembrane metalloprotease [Planctomycetota bacterium]
MTEPDNEPPLVTRAPGPAPEVPPAPRRPRPGFWEAVAWCAVFLMVQGCAGIATVCVVFAAYCFAAPEPGKFFNEQLDGYAKAADPKAEGGAAPLPFEIGQAIAWGLLAAQFVSLGLIALVLPRRIGPDWRRQIGFRAPAGIHVLLVLLIAPGFALGADAIQAALNAATGLKPPAVMKTLNGIFNRFPWPLTVLAVAVGPGVVEELWCRGFVGRGLSARYGLTAGVLLTSVFFAMMHLDPSQLLVYALMGAYLHFVYIATRSLWASVLLHAMNNGIAVLLVLVLPSEKLDQPTPIVVPLAALSLMIFGSVALWTGRAELQPALGASDAWWESDGWRPEYPGVSAPPPEANVRLGRAVMSPVALIFTFVSFAAVMYLGYRYLI